MNRYAWISLMLISAAGVVAGKGWMDSQQLASDARTTLTNTEREHTAIVRRLESQISEMQAQNPHGSRAVIERSIGFDAVFEVLESKLDRLVISSRFAAYADFSDPVTFERYRQLLKKRKADSADITVYLLEQTIRKARLEREFQNRWNAYKGVFKGEIRETPEAFGRLLKRYAEQKQATEPTEFPAFIELLWASELAEEKALVTSGVEVKTLDSASPLTFWIANDRVSAFSAGGGTYLSYNEGVARFLLSALERN